MQRDCRYTGRRATLTAWDAVPIRSHQTILPAISTDMSDCGIRAGQGLESNGFEQQIRNQRFDMVSGTFRTVIR
jgi:hypothetical protein